MTDPSRTREHLEVDDAIHAQTSGGGALLCGQSPVGRRTVPAQGYPSTDRGGAYCWTCLRVYNELRGDA